MGGAPENQPALMDARLADMAQPLRWYLSNERAILAVLSFVGFFAFWELGAALSLFDSYFFSSPSRVGLAALTEVQIPRFWNDVRVSGTEFVLGYIAAVVLGIPLGIAAGWYRKFNYFMDPWLNFLNALPRVALLPLIVLWVGIGIESKIVVVFLGAFITIVFNTLFGVRTVDQRLLEVAASFGASQGRVFTSVVLPGSVPFILAGLRLGVGRAVIGVIVGELYAANAGLGYMITIASHTLQTDRLLFGVLVLTFMGLAGVESVRLIEQRYTQWRPELGT